VGSGVARGSPLGAQRQVPCAHALARQGQQARRALGGNLWLADQHSRNPWLRWNRISHAAASGKRRVFAVFQTRASYNLRTDDARARTFSEGD